MEVREGCGGWSLAYKKQQGKGPPGLEAPQGPAGFHLRALSLAGETNGQAVCDHHGQCCDVGCTEKAPLSGDKLGKALLLQVSVLTSKMGPGASEEWKDEGGQAECFRHGVVPHYTYGW